MNFIKIIFSLYYMHMIATDGSLHIIMMTCRCISEQKVKIQSV
jgi:hypothetical protein